MITTPPGAYFVTVCTKNRRCLFWDIVGASIARPQPFRLSAWGEIVDKTIREIPSYYAAITVDRYTVMPNHIHLLLQIQTDSDGRPIVTPTISTVVQQFKGAVTKQIGQPVWQKLFYDHVIRNQQDYDEIWKYIDNNPVKWKEDCFYKE